MILQQKPIHTNYTDSKRMEQGIILKSLIATIKFKINHEIDYCLSLVRK